MQGKVLWVAVTNDRYELPIDVEDTGKALAEFLGIKENSLIKAIRRDSFKSTKWKAVKVFLDDEK